LDYDVLICQIGFRNVTALISFAGRYRRLVRGGSFNRRAEYKEDEMQKLMLSVVTAAFVGAATVASAADLTGTIKSMDPAKDTITLDKGQVLWLPKSIKIASFKVGEKVKVTYTESHSKMDVSAVAPAV